MKISHQTWSATVLVILLFSFSPSTSALIITEHIEYMVSIKNENADEEEWYRDNIAPSDRRPQLKQLLEDAENGKINVYDLLDRDFDLPPLTTTEVKNILYRTDTIYIESPNPLYDIQMTEVTEEPDIAIIRGTPIVVAPFI